jgi:NADH dehydrogenase/NADH:ubiquinone oxidoreductase subunit G
MTTGASDVTADSTVEQQQNPEEAPGAAYIEKIREIIFGATMRDYEARFLRLEERLMKDSDEIKQDIRNRTAALERLARDEIQALTERFKAEREERKEAIASTAAQIAESVRAVERKNMQLDDKTAESRHNVRPEIVDHSNYLSEQIRRQHEELARMVERRFEELRKSKTDRAALAGFLTEMAARLSGDSGLTRTEGPAE